MSRQAKWSCFARQRAMLSPPRLPALGSDFHASVWHRPERVASGSQAVKVSYDCHSL